MEIAAAVNALLRHQAALALFTDEGDPDLRDALQDVVDAAGSREGAKDGGDLSPPLSERDLEISDGVAGAVIQGAREAAERPAKGGGAPREGGSGEGGSTTSGTTPGGSTTGGGTTDGGTTGGGTTPDGSTTAPPPFQRYNLILEVKRIKAVHVTQPRDDEDEFLLAGGYSHGSGGRGSFRQWEHEFNEGDEVTLNPPHILKNVAVPQGTQQHFDGTLILNEEDWTSPALATALGTVVSIVLSAGVTAAVNYLRSQGLPSELTEEAQRVLREHGIKGVRSWFESLIGPEMFEIILVRATTNWPAQNQPVTWRSWIPYSPNTVRTTPHQSVGPGTHVGTTVTLREAKIVNADAGPTIRVVSDGGVYELDLQFRLVGS